MRGSTVPHSLLTPSASVCVVPLFPHSLSMRGSSLSQLLSLSASLSQPLSLSLSICGSTVPHSLSMCGSYLSHPLMCVALLPSQQASSLLPSQPASSLLPSQPASNVCGSQPASSLLPSQPASTFCHSLFAVLCGMLLPCHCFCPRSQL